MANNHKENVLIKVSSNKSSKGANLTRPNHGHVPPNGGKPVHDSYSINESVKHVPSRNQQPGGERDLTAGGRGRGLGGGRSGNSDE